MKPRRPWLALVLGLAWPGLGHLYAGVPWRAAAAVVYLLAVACPIILLIRVPLSHSVAGIGVLLSAVVLLVYIVAVDGMLVARRRRTEPLTSWNRVWIYLAYAVLFALIMKSGARWINDHFIFRAFSIPSSAMMDTLLPGDVILADMRRGKLLPLRRGEIVVFEPPRERGTLYVKRVLGLPGDSVEIRSGWVFINGQQLDEPYVEEPYRQGVGDSGPVAVGDGHYFVLGDRRNASYDSREWGQLPAELVRGRALHIYYSVAEPSAGVFGGIRWRRIGTPLTFDDAASQSE